MRRTARRRLRENVGRDGHGILGCSRDLAAQGWRPTSNANVLCQIDYDDPREIDDRWDGQASTMLWMLWMLWIPRNRSMSVHLDGVDQDG